MSGCFNEGREAYEASLHDDFDDHLDPSDYDDDEPAVAPYRCGDRMCGALDCANCHPEGCDEEC